MAPVQAAVEPGSYRRKIREKKDLLFNPGRKLLPWSGLCFPVQTQRVSLLILNLFRFPARTETQL